MEGPDGRKRNLEADLLNETAKWLERGESLFEQLSGIDMLENISVYLLTLTIFWTGFI